MLERKEYVLQPIATTNTETVEIPASSRMISLTPGDQGTYMASYFASGFTDKVDVYHFIYMDRNEDFQQVTGYTLLGEAQTGYMPKLVFYRLVDRKKVAK